MKGAEEKVDEKMEEIELKRGFKFTVYKKS